MGWGDCGTDSDGRPIGYVFEAVCDEPGCNKKIDRGLSYVCGDMHGEDEYSCEQYFCEEHKSRWVKMSDGRSTAVCKKCETALLEGGEWEEDEEEGELVQKLV